MITASFPSYGYCQHYVNAQDVRLSSLNPLGLGIQEESASPDAEADLLILIDGQAMLCEAKSSWHSLRLSDIDDLVSLAIKLRPDTALLAIMENGQGGPTVKLEEARVKLDAEGIRFEILTPSTVQILDDGPHLPYE